MMFDAGIGVGMLMRAVAEPIAHFKNNPAVIQGVNTALSQDNVREAYVWSFLYWGSGAWACYVIAGLSLAFFNYCRGLPLTIRAALTSLFSKALSSTLGYIVAVVAKILGVAQTLVFDVEQFVAGLTRIGSVDLANWILHPVWRDRILRWNLGLFSGAALAEIQCLWIRRC